jgi:hypothetical protein
LHFGDTLLDFLDHLVAPGGKGLGICPVVVQQIGLGYLQTIPPREGLSQRRVNVTGVIVFAVATKSQ